MNMDDKWPEMNLNVYALKKILEDLPDEMDVIIPVVEFTDVDTYDVAKIHSFVHVRTVGSLEHPNEEAAALCLAGSRGGADMYTLIKMMNSDTTVKRLYY